MKRTLLLFFSLIFSSGLYAQIILTPGTNTDDTPVIDRASNSVYVATTGSWNMSYARLSPLISGTYIITTVSTAALYGPQWVYATLYGENDASVQIELSTVDQTGPAGDLDEVTIAAYLTAGEVYNLGLGVTLVETIGLNIEYPSGGGLLGFVWMGRSDSNWATGYNWNWDAGRAGDAVPKSWNNVTIPDVTNDPVISTTTQAECVDLTVASGASLTINSDASSTGSLIVHGIASGTVNAQRYMTGSTWHIISGATSGQNVADFLTANSNIASSSGKRGMADYNTSGNAWNPYFTTGSGTVDAGKGYEMRLTGNGTVTFSGALTTGDKLVSVSDQGEGWNCIGNPYTSAIGVKSTATSGTKFLTENSTNLDPSYLCAYLWDPASSTYKIIGDLPTGIASERGLNQDFIQSGQGFFVKVKSGASTVQFKSTMQAHQPTTELKSADASWAYFTLNAAAAQTNASTTVAFNKNMTKGLDPSFDAGLLRGSNGLSLYSRLVDDNGVDFAIQCLPESYSNLVIPVGIDAKAGGEIVFSAKAVGMPTGSAIILEDKTTGALTSLAEGATYKATVAANSNGTGRFFIHTSDLTTGVGLVPDGKTGLKSYQANNQIVIEGNVTSLAKAYLYTTNGVLLGQYQLQEGNYNKIPAADLLTGVYLVKVVDGNNQFNSKTVIQ